MDDRNRLKKVIVYLDLNQSKFAESIGYSADTINKIMNGHAEISKNLARSITKKYLMINLYWLLTGQGKMIIDPDNPAAFRDETKDPKYVEERSYMDLLNENYILKKYEAENKILKKLVEKLEVIDTLTKSAEISKLDTQTIIKEFEEKCEKILEGSINKIAEKFNHRIDETESKILKNFKNNL